MTFSQRKTPRILLPFPEGCRVGRFVSRHKRFTVYIQLDGKVVSAHTNNTGSMLGLLRPGNEVLLSPATNPKRKLPYTLELVRVGSMWVGVNTATPNRLLHAAVQEQVLPEASGYERFLKEQRYGESRLDACLTGKPGRLWLEAKNVTMVEDEIAAFPDAATERGRKHVKTLMQIVAAGERAALFFCIQRPDGKCFGPADYVDPEYAQLLARAGEVGVEIWPYRAVVSRRGISLGARLDVVFPDPEA